MEKGLAGAAALAALHPLDFDPDDKLTFAAGVGNYRGSTAGAVGAFYRPDERIMFSLGGTFGNSENMVNVGVSFTLDKNRGLGGGKAAMAKKIAAQEEKLAAQEAENAEQRAEIQALKEALVRLEAKVNKK